MKKLVIAFTSALLVGSSVLVGMDNEAMIDAARAALEIEGLDGTEQAAPAEMAAPIAPVQDEPMPQAQRYTFRLLDGDRLECTETASGRVLVVVKTIVDGNSSWHLVGQDAVINEDSFSADFAALFDQQLARLKLERLNSEIPAAAAKMQARIDAKRLAVSGAAAAGAAGLVAAAVEYPAALGMLLGTLAHPFVAVPVGVGAAAAYRYRASLKRGVGKIRGFVANMNPAAKRRRMDDSQQPK